MTSSRSGWCRMALAAAMACVCAAPALAQRPNILVIMPDDVGYPNVGIYSHGMMVPTPKIAAGKVSNGIQSHEGKFTALASAAGHGDARGELKARDKVCIDGVDNLAHWTGNAPSARNVQYYYEGSNFTAVRVGPWKTHQQTREGFFDYFRQNSLVFNLRMDPFERHDGQKSNDLAMRMGVALGGQIQDAVTAHMATFQECKPRQEGGTLRMGSK